MPSTVEKIVFGDILREVFSIFSLHYESAEGRGTKIPSWVTEAGGDGGDDTLL